MGKGYIFPCKITCVFVTKAENHSRVTAATASTRKRGAKAHIVTAVPKRATNFRRRIPAVPVIAGGVFKTNSKL